MGPVEHPYYEATNVFWASFRFVETRRDERKVLCPYRYAAVVFSFRLQPVTDPISVQATSPYLTCGEANQSRNATTDRRFLASTEMRVDRDD